MADLRSIKFDINPFQNHLIKEYLKSMSEMDKEMERFKNTPFSIRVGSGKQEVYGYGESPNHYSDAMEYALSRKPDRFRMLNIQMDESSDYLEHGRKLEALLTGTWRETKPDTWFIDISLPDKRAVAELFFLEKHGHRILKKCNFVGIKDKIINDFINKSYARQFFGSSSLINFDKFKQLFLNNQNTINDGKTRAIQISPITPTIRCSERRAGDAISGKTSNFNVRWFNKSNLKGVAIS